MLAYDYLKPTNTMAVSVWVWAESHANWASIAKNWGTTQAGQFHFGLTEDSGLLGNYLTDGGGTTVSAIDAVPLPLGSWQHVAFIADGARVRLYRNGLQVAESATYNGTLLVPPMASLGIGVKTDDSGAAPAAIPGYWHGKLDDLGIWNRALTPDEIFGIYQAGLAGKGITEASAIKLITLTVSASGNQVTVQFEAGSLEWADDLTGAWTAVPGASAPGFTTTANAAKKFFRVR